jgi:hypothetical protein
MGAQQSAGRDGNAQGAEALKRCYYEVLGTERHATDDESVPIPHPGKRHARTNTLSAESRKPTEEKLLNSILIVIMETSKMQLLGSLKSNLPTRCFQIRRKGHGTTLIANLSYEVMMD